VGVTRRCTRDQEAASYVYFEDAFDSLDRLKELCASIPVHTILGSDIDLVYVLRGIAFDYQFSTGIDHAKLMKE
jgi:hypothetical protein